MTKLFKSKVMHTFLLTALAAGIVPVAARAADALFAAAPIPALPTGLWLTEGKDGVIELYSCEADSDTIKDNKDNKAAKDDICGRFYWVKPEANGEISRDNKNPDPAKQNRPLCNMQFMYGFKPSSTPGQFTDGSIYSPRHGKVFHAEMTLVDANTLKLRGYILTPVLGESQIWTRATNAESCQEE